MSPLPLVVMLLVLVASAADAAPPRPRPYSGAGVLAPRSDHPSYWYTPPAPGDKGRGEEDATGGDAADASAASPPLPGKEVAQPPLLRGSPPLVLYREPGLGRVGEFDPGALPRLAGNGSDPLLPVSARKGGWSRVAYDDAGREGWVDPGRAWQYRPWEEFLPGRVVRILPGMKIEFYALRSEPRREAAGNGTLVRDQTVRVLLVDGDWARLEAPSGWFRWRDGDGRLTISLQ